MQTDEQAIRELIQTWLTASAAGDLDQVLSLMCDDVVFLTVNQKPFGKEAFTAASRAAHGKVRITAHGDVQEVQVAGEMAHCRTQLRVTILPVQGGEPRRLSGYTLSVFRKMPDGRWRLARDANLLTPEPAHKIIQSAVPVFRVASVARSIAWYQTVLGFGPDPFGPPEEPVFAILRRDGVELMLQKADGQRVMPRRQRTELEMDAYIRVLDINGLRAAVLAIVPDVEPIVTREYGCREFTLTDPDGHVLVLGECS